VKQTKKRAAVNLEPTAYLTYAQMNGGRSSSLNDFRVQLSRFARDDLILFCSYANTALFGPDLTWDWEIHDLLVKTYLNPRLADARSSNGERWPILHRQLLLFLAKEATAGCPVTGLSPRSGTQGELTSLVLMANDHLGFPPALKIPGENNLGFLAVVVASAEGSRFASWRHKMVRTALILENVLERSPALAKEFNVFELFEKATGVPLRAYISMIFAVASKRLNEEHSTGQLPAPHHIGSNWFRDTILSRDQIASFFEDVAVTAEAAGSSIRSEISHISDFRVFADKPLLQVGDNYFPIDFDLLVGKADSGIFWKVLSHLPTKKTQDAFIAFWGKIFELYVNWVLSRCTPDAMINRFVPDPRFEDDHTDQVCDAIILNGSTACFVEYKGVVFRAGSKYTGDPFKLREEIDAKLIGTQTNRKGLLQLAKAIEDVSGSTPRKIQDVDLSGVTKIVPVIVVRDEIALSLCFNEYLNFRFRKITGRQAISRTITPLFSLAIDDLEKIASYLDKIPFHKILEDRWRAEKNLSAPFFAVENPSMVGSDSRPAKVALEGMDIVARLGFEIMFGQPLSPST